ncbi:hypothetical protein [Nostoc sp. PA-18-2419]|uniref:hypothetical protein n=1 Tax=Nostoc sp. PA-18-2419 TaxID=2575443 RepID=UPI0016797394|nr:hypothetical protein [Nostoc sp. PA-18-2419]
MPRHAQNTTSAEPEAEQLRFTAIRPLTLREFDGEKKAKSLLWLKYNWISSKRSL